MTTHLHDGGVEGRVSRVHGGNLLHLDHVRLHVVRGREFQLLQVKNVVIIVVVIFVAIVACVTTRELTGAISAKAREWQHLREECGPRIANKNTRC